MDAHANTEGRIMIDEPRPMAVIGNRIKAISIQELDRGYIVNVGCQAFAIETKEALIEKLITYINNPAQTEIRYNSGELFK